MTRPDPHRDEPLARASRSGSNMPPAVPIGLADGKRGERVSQGLYCSTGRTDESFPTSPLIAHLGRSHRRVAVANWVAPPAVHQAPCPTAGSPRGPLPRPTHRRPIRAPRRLSPRSCTRPPAGVTKPSDESTLRHGGPQRIRPCAASGAENHATASDGSYICRPLPSEANSPG